MAGGTITSCYSTATVSGTGNHVGSLVGFLWTENGIGACFWDVMESGNLDGVGNINPDPAGAIGKATWEMKIRSTFASAPANWDFTNETANGTNDIWRMCADGADYPRLNWESLDGDFACPDGVSIEDLDYTIGWWLKNNCKLTNNYCGGADIDRSGTVDMVDFIKMAQHWLEGT